MPDLMDQVQDRVLFDTELAVRRATEKPKAARTHCEECDEPISPHRQALHAQLCIDCQTAVETRARQRGQRSA